MSSILVPSSQPRRPFISLAQKVADQLNDMDIFVQTNPVIVKMFGCKHKSVKFDDKLGTLIIAKSEEGQFKGLLFGNDPQQQKVLNFKHEQEAQSCYDLCMTDPNWIPLELEEIQQYSKIPAFSKVVHSTTECLTVEDSCFKKLFNTAFQGLKKLDPNLELSYIDGSPFFKMFSHGLNNHDLQEIVDIHQPLTINDCDQFLFFIKQFCTLMFFDQENKDSWFNSHHKKNNTLSLRSQYEVIANLWNDLVNVCYDHHHYTDIEQLKWTITECAAKIVCLSEWISSVDQTFKLDFISDPRELCISLEHKLDSTEIMIACNMKLYISDNSIDCYEINKKTFEIGGRDCQISLGLWRNIRVFDVDLHQRLMHMYHAQRNIIVVYRTQDRNLNVQMDCTIEELINLSNGYLKCVLKTKTSTKCIVDSSQIEYVVLYNWWYDIVNTVYSDEEDKCRDNPKTYEDINVYINKFCQILKKRFQHCTQLLCDYKNNKIGAEFKHTFEEQFNQVCCAIHKHMIDQMIMYPWSRTRHYNFSFTFDMLDELFKNQVVDIKFLLHFMVSFPSLFSFKPEHVSLLAQNHGGRDTINLLKKFSDRNFDPFADFFKPELVSMLSETNINNNLKNIKQIKTWIKRGLIKNSYEQKFLPCIRVPIDFMTQWSNDCMTQNTCLWLYCIVDDVFESLGIKITLSVDDITSIISFIYSSGCQLDQEGKNNAIKQVLRFCCGTVVSY